MDSLLIAAKDYRLRRSLLTLIHWFQRTSLKFK
jgi:hypothetical protein